MSGPGTREDQRRPATPAAPATDWSAIFRSASMSGIPFVGPAISASNLQATAMAATPIQERGWLGTAFDYATVIGNDWVVSPLSHVLPASIAGASVSAEAATQARLRIGSAGIATEMARPDGNPAQALFTQITTDANRAQITTITNDPRFMAALNRAMLEDPTVVPGLVGLASGTGTAGTPDTATLITGLQDPSARRMFTDVLTKVAEDPNLNFSYVLDVTRAAHNVRAANRPDPNKDKEDLQAVLARAGIRNAGLDFSLNFGRDPIQAIRDLFQNPGQIAEILGLQGVQGQRVAGLAQGVAGFLTLNRADQASMDRIFNRGEQYFRDITGMTDADIAAGRQPADPALVGDQNNLNLRGARVSVDTAFARAQAGIQPPDAVPVAPAPAATPRVQPGMTLN